MSEQSQNNLQSFILFNNWLVVNIVHSCLASGTLPHFLRYDLHEINKFDNLILQMRKLKHNGI